MTEQPTEPDLAAGKVIAGRFRLERLLGKGGMGSVWAAQHLSLNIEVALKFIDAAVAAKRGDVASRFEQEAQAAAKIKGSHVVNILDYGTDEAGRAYIAMELLQGEELSRRLERCDQMPIADVCRVVVHACRGLGRAHAAGIVHRDIKPENLFLVEEEDDGFIVKVLDFGIAKAHSPVGAVTPRTDTGQLLGTPLYMSPEQALGTGDVDFRSDLYSLAVVAFRCLTGSVPFYSKALGELIVKVSTEAVPSARAKRPDLPPEVDEWFQRAMHKDPAKRFASAREMSALLVRACGLGGAPTDALAIPGSRPSGAQSGPEPDLDAWLIHDEPTPAPGVHEAPTIAAEVPEGVPSKPRSTPSRQAVGASDSVSAARPETLIGATATYTPPSSRTWFSVIAAAALMLLLVGSIVVLATRPFGPSGPFASLLHHDRVSPDAVSAVAPKPPPSAPPEPVASPTTNALPSPATPARQASSGATAKSSPPASTETSRRHPPPRPLRPPKAPPLEPAVAPPQIGSPPTAPTPAAHSPDVPGEVLDQ